MAIQFVRLLNSVKMKKILFIFSVLALFVFFLVCMLQTISESLWFLLGVIPFLMSVFVCYVAYVRKTDVYFLDCISCAVSLLFAIYYILMYWESNYSSHVDALSGVAWVTIIPVHMFLYILSILVGLAFYYLYSRFYSIRK